MDLAEMDWYPSKAKKVWKDKVIGKVVPYLKKNQDDFVSADEIKKLGTRVDDMFKNVKNGNLFFFSDYTQTPQKQPSSNTVTNVSGYSIRV